MTWICGSLVFRSPRPFRGLVALALALGVAIIGLEATADRADAAVQPVVHVEPSTGVALGSVVITGSGFSSGGAVTVSNQTTGSVVCSTTAASDGTISCAGVAGATAGTTSAIGVGGSTASYVAVGSAQIATIAGGGIGDGGLLGIRL